MPRNTNLGLARIAMAAIALTPDNAKKFGSYGAMQAARSPQLAQLIKEMSPVNAAADGRLSIIQGQSTPQARVALSYRPQYQATIKTSRTVSTGARPVEGSSLNVDYTTHREDDMTYETVDMMRLEKETEDYLKLANAGNLSVNIPQFELLSDMGDQIMRKVDSILTNVNNTVLTSMIAGIGGNLLIGQASPANVAVQNITAFNADGGVNPNVMDFFTNLKKVHRFSGRPIVVGGLKAATYFSRKNIVSAADLGYDYAKVFNALDVEFYYDPAVDTLSGQDHIIVLDPGSFCLETIAEHDLVIKPKKVANTSYGSATISIAQTDAPSFSLNMDLRVREEDTAYPRLTVTPSFHYGTFTRPAGYFKNYEGWDTVTGIIRARLNTAA